MKRKYSTSTEIRTKARDALRNRWVIAVVACLIACLFGKGFGSGGARFEYESDSSAHNENMMSLENHLTEYMEAGDLAGAMEYVFTDSFVAVFLVIGAAVAVFSLLYVTFIGAPLTVGYNRFNLELYNKRQEMTLKPLLYAFRHCYWRVIGVFLLKCLILGGIGLAGGVVFGLLVGFAVVLGNAFLLAFSLLIGYTVLALTVVAVIVKAYGYAMTGYLLADGNQLSVRETLGRSKQMMEGNKWRLFSLQISFIGWMLLALVFTLGLGLIVVVPYMSAAEAAFYRELAHGGKKPSFLVKLFGN